LGGSRPGLRSSPSTRESIGPTATASGFILLWG
jgi:hypothetical protein